MNHLILYCRPGFEKEAAAEITDLAGPVGVYGYAKTTEGSGLVSYVTHDDDGAWQLMRQLDFNQLIFTRQWFAAVPLLDNLPEQNRVAPLVELAAEIAPGKLAEFSVEYVDTNEGKELSAFCRKITVPLRQALKKRGLMKPAAKYRLHLLFLSGREAWVGISTMENSSNWAMGIPRLKVPRDAPSRATLKLEEAWHFFIPAEEWADRLKARTRAVDLGAAPGGWTYQLVARGLTVYAVDNGPMAPELMATGMVEHVRADAFLYEPRKPVQWLVSDIADKPARVAELVGRWLAKGWCREAVFNLKLPMKQRYQVVLDCKARIEARLEEAGVFRYELNFRQLYHDREEVTGHVRRLPD
ncbi:23S rRNA (cytidine(2498)-2'-O)-methyltransferase RlmM [Porticoccus sp.]